MQVALSVAFIPVAVMRAQEVVAEREGTGFPADAFLSGRLIREDDGRAAELFEEVHRRLAADPGVVATTRASRLPGFNHPAEAMEIDGDSARVVNGRQVGVDPNFFDVLDARVVSGRAFNEGDRQARDGVAIVDQAWARKTLGGQSPIGRRIRYPRRAGDEAERWYEIVGVVAGMDRAVGPGTTVGVFHPLRQEGQASLQFYVRTAGLPASLVPQVHALVVSVDPAMGVVDLMPLEEIWRPVERSEAALAAALGVVALIIVLFALIGIYALTSFTVARRAREIGIRAALGANPRRIIATIFSRALSQIGLGILIGGALVSLTIARSPEGVRLVGAVAMAMVGVGLMGCVVPAMRALRIHPAEALRSE
jgi:putative ABC transport system permease protein